MINKFKASLIKLKMSSRSKSYRKYSEIGNTGNPDYNDPSVLASVMTITSPEQKTEILASNRVVVIDIWAQWCQPCRDVAPRYAVLAKKYNVPGKCLLCKENVDLRLSDVNSIPCFRFYLNGKQIHEIIGGNIKEIEKTIQKLLET